MDLNTIKVVASHREEIQANQADLIVTIKGSSLITGNAALAKAKEVSSLVSELVQNGVSRNDIQLQSIYAEASSNILGKMSVAYYQLRIRCQNLDNMAEMLGIITDQKNTTLNQIVWKYLDDDTARHQWLGQAIRQANEKARVIASALNVEITGVHQFSETYFDPDDATGISVRADSSTAAMGRRRLTSESLGVAVINTKEVVVQVEVKYYISGYSQDLG